MNLYEKAAHNEYLEKHNKNGDLIRTAERFDSGVWIVQEYSKSKTNIMGEYSNEEFNKLRNRYFKTERRKE